MNAWSRRAVGISAVPAAGKEQLPYTRLPTGKQKLAVATTDSERSPGNELEQRVARLEQEVATLREMLARLTSKQGTGFRG